MSVYTRGSRKRDLDSMTPALAQALRQWAEDLDLAAVLESAVAGCETVSERRHAAGVFGRMQSLPRRVECGALLTPEWLVWATLADDAEPRVVGVRLLDFDVVDYRTTDEYRRMLDNGLQVSGCIGDDAEPASCFIGLGEDPPGEAFKEKVLAAWSRAREAAS